MPRRWPGSCRPCPRRSGRSCRASSSVRAWSTGRIGCAPTRRHSPRSSASSRRTCSTRSCRPAGAWRRRRSRSRTAGSRPASSASAGVHGPAGARPVRHRAAVRRGRPGRLLFVEENIRESAHLGVPLGPFRTWIALHETTHAFEFEAHPWLRPYLASRLERQLTCSGVTCVGSARRRCVGLAARYAVRAAGSTGWSG